MSEIEVGLVPASVDALLVGTEEEEERPTKGAVDAGLWFIFAANGERGFAQHRRENNGCSQVKTHLQNWVW